jgi:hypothetical protein
MNEKGIKLIRDSIANNTELFGFAEALQENSKQYPTYFDLQKRHDDYFKVKEKINSITNEIVMNPAIVSSLEEFRNSITNSQKSVQEGLFLTDEELEQETSKW